MCHISGFDLSDPDDSYTRLVLADYLEERGQDVSRLRWWAGVRPTVRADWGGWCHVPNVAGAAGGVAWLAALGTALFCCLSLDRVDYEAAQAASPSWDAAGHRRAVLAALVAGELLALDLLPVADSARASKDVQAAGGGSTDVDIRCITRAAAHAALAAASEAATTLAVHHAALLHEDIHAAYAAAGGIVRHLADGLDRGDCCRYS